MPALLAASLLVAFLGSMSLTAYLEHRVGAGREGIVGSVSLIAGLTVFMLLGALLTWRQPRNPMGWLFVGITLMVAIAPIGPAYVDLVLYEGGEPTAQLAMLAGVNNWYWGVLLGCIFVFVPLLFPDGRLLSRRWRPIVWITGASIATVTAMGVVAEEITTQGLKQTLPNPIGIAGVPHPEESLIGLVALVGVVIGFVGAFSSLVFRFRRARGQERAQIKLLVLAAGVAFVSFAIGTTLPERAAPLRELVSGTAFLALPLAITVAVLRYKLYAIDRIISRTISYGLVVAVLAGTYAGCAMVLGRLLAPLGTGNDLAVAAATLAAAAVFRPLVVRVRAVVDRRFNRARYDSQRTLEAFSQRLRDEVDLTVLEEELHAVVSRAMQPAVVGLWVRDGSQR